MQDFAGIRIVHDMNRAEQRVLADLVRGLFDGAEISDRPARTTNGNRALHVLARIDTCLIEIQVRTAAQHQWAEIVERLGDALGRQIRYGEPPIDTERPVGGAGRTRAVSGSCSGLGDMIADAEKVMEEILTMRTRYGVNVPDDLVDLEEFWRGHMAKVRSLLDDLGTIAP